MLLDFVRDVLFEIWFSSCVTLQADPLIDYLRQLEAQGQTYVNVDDDARLLLREFYRRAQGRLAPVAAQQAPAISAVSVASAEKELSASPVSAPPNELHG